MAPITEARAGWSHCSVSISHISSLSPSLLCGLLLCLFGQLLLVITFLMTGPAHYLPLTTSLPLSLAGLVIEGLGSAIVIVTTYTSCIKETLETPGYPETVATGVWISKCCLLPWLVY